VRESVALGDAAKAAVTWWLLATVGSCYVAALGQTDALGTAASADVALIFFFVFNLSRRRCHVGSARRGGGGRGVGLRRRLGLPQAGRHMPGR